MISAWIIGVVVAAVVLYLMYRRRRPALNYEGAVLAFALSPTCTYCKMSHPAWLQVKGMHSGLATKLLVRGEDDAELEPLGIEAYPTFVLWRNDREVSRTMGAKTADDLDRWLTQALVDSSVGKCGKPGAAPPAAAAAPSAEANKLQPVA